MLSPAARGRSFVLAQSSSSSIDVGVRRRDRQRRRLARWPREIQPRDPQNDRCAASAALPRSGRSRASADSGGSAHLVRAGVQRPQGGALRRRGIRGRGFPPRTLRPPHPVRRSSLAARPGVPRRQLRERGAEGAVAKSPTGAKTCHAAPDPPRCRAHQAGGAPSRNRSTQTPEAVPCTKACERAPAPRPKQARQCRDRPVARDGRR